jgi:predicted small integral membrane protein
MKLEWMAWTTPTAIFFLVVFTMLFVMTVISVKWPSVKRKGFLPISTTRGDRLYIGLIISAFVNLIWLGFSDAAMWGALAICAAWLLVVMRWG